MSRVGLCRQGPPPSLLAGWQALGGESSGAPWSPGAQMWAVQLVPVGEPWIPHPWSLCAESCDPGRARQRPDLHGAPQNAAGLQAGQAWYLRTIRARVDRGHQVRDRGMRARMGHMGPGDVGALCPSHPAQPSILRLGPAWLSSCWAPHGREGVILWVGSGETPEEDVLWPGPEEAADSRVAGPPGHVSGTEGSVDRLDVGP